MRLAEKCGLGEQVRQRVHLPGSAGANAAGKVATICLADIDARAPLIHHIHRRPLSSHIHRQGPIAGGDHQAKESDTRARSNSSGCLSQDPQRPTNPRVQLTPSRHDVSRRPEPEFHPLRVPPPAGDLLTPKRPLPNPTFSYGQGSPPPAGVRLPKPTSVNAPAALPPRRPANTLPRQLCSARCPCGHGTVTLRYSHICTAVGLETAV